MPKPGKTGFSPAFFIRNRLAQAPRQRRNAAPVPPVALRHPFLQAFTGGGSRRRHRSARLPQKQGRKRRRRSATGHGDTPPTQAERKVSPERRAFGRQLPQKQGQNHPFLNPQGVHAPRMQGQNSFTSGKKPVVAPGCRYETPPEASRFLFRAPGTGPAFPGRSRRLSRRAFRQRRPSFIP